MTLVSYRSTFKSVYGLVFGGRQVAGSAADEDSEKEYQCATPAVIAAGNRTVHQLWNRPRRWPLYFSGTVGKDAPTYSHGVRQTLANMYRVAPHDFPGMFLVFHLIVCLLPSKKAFVSMHLLFATPQSHHGTFVVLENWQSSPPYHLCTGMTNCA